MRITKVVFIPGCLVASITKVVFTPSCLVAI